MTDPDVIPPELPIDDLDAPLAVPSPLGDGDGEGVPEMPAL